MAAAAESATVFLETSLGTRLVVSFPASGTTVADLKRQVTAEHAVCFPQTGPIAVDSMQVRLDGSSFHLTDSMAVEGAFRCVQGPWRILVVARKLRPHSPAHNDVGCRSSDDSEQHSGNPVVSHSTQNLPPPALSQGSGNLATGEGVSDIPLLNQIHRPHQDVKHVSNQNDVPHVDKPHQDVERGSNQVEDNNTLPANLANGDRVSDTPLLNQLHTPHQDGKHVSNQIDVSHVDKPQEDVECGSIQVEDNNTVLANLASGDDFSDTPLLNQLHTPHQDVKHASNQIEDENTVPPLDKLHQDVECASNQVEYGNTVPYKNSDLCSAAGGNDAPLMAQQDQSHEGVKKHASGQPKDGNVNTLSQETSDINLPASGSVLPPKNQLNKSDGSVNPALGHCKHGHVKTMPEESTDLDGVASESESSKRNQLDKSHEDVRASGQLEDEIEKVMPQKSSDVDESAAAKDNDPMQGQQKDVIAEPRGTELFGKENRNDEIIIPNCDDNISSTSSTVNINLVEEKIRTEQENLNSNLLPYSQGNCSRDIGKKPSHVQKGPQTYEVCNGESSNVSDTPPSKDRDSTSNTKVSACRSTEEEPWVAGLRSGESSLKETDIPHGIKSMEEGNKRPDSNDPFLKKRKYEDDATASISTEHESCSKVRKQRFCVRKLSISKAAKLFGIRS